ncbi:hypothetical protein HN51_041216 [Arachis hypogaea]|uniref:GATA-type domain-containing protein n=1 Tax=Arachis hypogaea TaxID=3818 RepID=A0A444YRJ5_ARAHY|nr:GATA transcription factor 2 [Arachis ipaensis]XP_025658482.1 GATA transcription factor 2 [Arachis hypogaea]QHN86929.1 GATA transcription factor [Arachis hypogaea]RYR04548.1 hypothetical protein Ahy_B06g084309 [Arachis hypogaea]
MNMEGEFQKEQQVLLVADPASCSKLSTSSTTLDDLFSAQNTEVDVGLEWLSVFVEECFSNPPSYILGPSKSVEATTTTTITTCSSNKNPSSTALLKQNNNNDSSLQNFSVPSKARSKRKRLSAVTNRRRTKTPFSIWSHQNDEPLISDPPLLKQTYWLADSELFVLPKQQKKDSEKDVIAKDGDDDDKDGGGEKGAVVMKRGSLVSLEECSEAEEDGDGGNNNNNNNNNNGENPMPRRCTHCLAQRTPQWRAGPLGPKTLCNACGVRYKSGRLLPEYRPAKSPTFVSYLHSNSHKKVMEMRMAGSVLHS